MLERMWDDEEEGSDDTPPAEAGGRLLRSFIDSFVTEDFLPEVYVDFRWTLVNPASPCVP